jgi:hypothetical protein
MILQLKKCPGPGLCPVKGCRNRLGIKKAYCHKHANRLWRFRYPIRAAYLLLKGHAKSRKREFSLSYAEFHAFVSSNGYIAGKGNQAHCLHIDRVDETRGYHRDNIQALTCSENVAKENRKRFVPYFQKFNECPF